MLDRFIDFIFGVPFYEFLRGPMVWISVIVFLLGMVYQVFRFYRASRPEEPWPVPAIPGKKPGSGDGIDRDSWWYRLEMLKLTVFGKYPRVMLVSLVFHIALFTAPIFLYAHNELLEWAYGIRFFSLPDGLTDFLTLLLLLCAVFFLYRRIFVPRVRAITGWGDYVLLAIAVLPYLTGFLAYHRIFDYRTVIILHMMAGELMLLVIPFTKFVHMIFFFINRFVVVGRLTLGRGARTW